MPIPTDVIIALNLIALILLAWRFARLRQLNDALAQAAAQVGAPATTSQELADLLNQDPETLISIKILNPMQLAAKESWFAEMFGNLSPALVRKIVNERAQKIIVEELKKYGVEADVGLHRA